MSKKHHKHPIPAGGAGKAVSESRTPLRDNLESIVMAILMVLVVRQVVVEAYKIPTGSMAPTLLGVHKEVRCPNCGWTFRVGHEKVGLVDEVECPNCHYTWPGASEYYPGQYGGEQINFRRPAWLWNLGSTAVSEQPVRGMEAANRVSRWGSRIFVNKFLYKIRDPRRWEVIVFRYPYLKAQCRDCGWEGDLDPDGPHRCPVDGSTNLAITRKNYIKRLIGLPGETVLIRHGDIYISPSDQPDRFQLARKPHAVQQRLWIPCFDSSYVPQQLIRRRWEYLSAGNHWQENETTGALTCDATDAGEGQLVRFARPILDTYAYNGNQREVRNDVGIDRFHTVGDLRLRLRLTAKSATAAPDAAVLLGITEDDHEFRLVLPVRGGEARLEENGETVARSWAEPIGNGDPTEVALENYDDRVVASLAGNVLFQHDYSGAPEPVGHRQDVTFGARGVKVTFHRIRIDRDIYYIARRGRHRDTVRYELDDDSYMVLGDNSPASSDSRAWPNPQVPAENLMGQAFAIFWPIHDIELLSIGTQPEKKGEPQ